MSILYNETNHAFIDHLLYITNIYRNVSVQSVDTVSYKLNKKLFCILRDDKGSNRKRKLGNDELQEECSKVKTMYEKFLISISNTLTDITKVESALFSTSDVRNLSQELFESTIFDFKGSNGGNHSEYPLMCKIKDECFLIPPKCRFYCGCIVQECEKLSGSKFDIVIADPPWWNKYIRRLKNSNDKLSYTMMYNEDIASIPVQNLLAPNCLIAVWCTNAPSNVAAVKDLIFPKWGVEYVTTWYWLKVTTDMKPLCDFSAGCKKQPYERIIIGRVGDVKIPESKLVVSVPSALHSHKPPLLELLSPCVGSSDPQILELFARYLLPNTTSVGYEPLKWQHISLYDKVS